MVVGIDIRFLGEGKRTGVEEYAINLLHNMFRTGDQHNFKLFANYRRGTNKFINQFGTYPNVTIYRFRHSNKLINLSFAFLQIPKIDKMIKGCEVFFYPNIIFGAVSEKCPVVTTFHDLSFDLHPEFLSLKKRFWHRLVDPQRQANASARILAVSESTKADLISLYGIPPGKIQVVHSGITVPPAELEDQAKSIRRKYKLPDNFVLFFGTLEPRKNVIGALKAFEYLKKHGKINEQLVIAGSPGWLDKTFWQALAKSPQRDEIKTIGFVDQRDKLALFSLAEILVFPSFYEGFGFPPLEAMSVGTPVVTSSVSSLPEVVKDSAVLVNPYNVRDIAAAVENLVNDPVLRAKMIYRGWRRVQDFSWEKTARQTLSVLEEAERTRSN